LAKIIQQCVDVQHAELLHPFKQKNMPRPTTASNRRRTLKFHVFDADSYETLFGTAPIPFSVE